MTLVAVPQTPLWMPNMASTYGNMTLDAANEKAAYIVRAPKAGNIDRVCFRTGNVATGETVDVRMETLDASGNPSGTLWGTNTNASKVIGNADDNTWMEVTLTAAATVARGDTFAVVVALPGVTSAALNISRGAGAVAFGFPYTDNYTGSWSKSTAAPIGALRYDDGTYPYTAGLHPWSSVASTGLNSGSTPDEIGNKITVPFPCTVAGLWCWCGLNTVNTTFKLYDNSSSVLASVALDGDMSVLTSQCFIHLGSDVTLAAGDVVRATFAPSASGTNAFIMEATAPSGLGSAHPGGTAVVRTSRTDGGAWTDVSDQFAGIGLVISALDDGAGGGGGTTQGNLGSILRGVAH